MSKVFINPGHSPNGDPDPGAVNLETGLRECDVALLIGNMVSGYLQDMGCETQVLQSDSLDEICSEANEWAADVFVSIHCNSVAANNAKGIESWYCDGSTEGKKLADYIVTQIMDSITLINRGTKDAKPHVNGLYVLTNTNMTAVLVETAFISNHDDEKILSSAEGQDMFAAAIARGITDYVGGR